LTAGVIGMRSLVFLASLLSPRAHTVDGLEGENCITRNTRVK